MAEPGRIFPGFKSGAAEILISDRLLFDLIFMVGGMVWKFDDRSMTCLGSARDATVRARSIQAI
jgi:hypothetical protein